MKTKSDRLISELLSIMSRYSRNEFEEALQRLRGGEIEPALDLTAALANSPEQPRAQKQSPKQKLTSSQLLQRQIKEFHSHSDRTRNEIASFLTDAMERKTLPTTSAIRYFADALGLPPTSSKTDRATHLRRIGYELSSLPPDIAADFMNRARAVGNEPSSLQSWANLIVKP